MLVIVEGPDGSGKTTLIEQLRDHGHFILIRTSGPPPSLSYVHDFCSLVSTETRETIITDRHPYISEPIYSKVLGRIPLHHIPRPSPHLVIYCRPSVIPQLDPQAHLPGLASRTEYLYQVYDQWYLTENHFDIFRYDYLTNQLDDVVEAIWSK